MTTTDEDDDAMTMNALWWWIDRWRKSTAYTDMTLEQQGAYRNLLDEASLRGGAIPDDERVLAKACGDAKAWRRLRAVLLARFELQADGWHNQTLDAVLHESERRAKNQAAWRSRRGNKPDNAAGLTADNTPDNKPDSPSPSPEEQIQKHTQRARAGAQGPGAFEPGSLPRDHVNHALCGLQFRLCLSPHVYGKLAGKYGGDDAATALQGFVNKLEIEHQTIGDYLWLEGHFMTWLRAIGRLTDAPTPSNSARNRSQKPTQTVEEILAEIEALPK